jgi:probable LLM family oxidoreductase
MTKKNNSMEIGISMFGDNHFGADEQPLAVETRLHELIAEIKLMDETGLDFFGIGEHHRPDYAVAVPEIILAAAATVTKQIKLGSAVSVLSSSDPVKLYQAFSTIDLLSKGRAEITAGRGSFIESFPLYGYNLADYDTLFDEKLHLLDTINKTVGPLTWKGKHRAALTEQLILPRAYNEHLKIWVAVGGTPESVLRAAKLGLPVIFAIIGGNPAQFKPLFDYYRKAYLHFGHAPEKMELGVHMHAFFGENSAATAAMYYPYYAAQMNRVGASRGWPPYQREQYDMGTSPQGHLIIGDVDEAVNKILYLKDLLGLTRFSAHMDVGGPPHDALMQSIDLFGRQIAPKVKAAIAHN